VFVNKTTLGKVLACEAHLLAEQGDFAWTLAAARGTVAHKAIQLSVGRPPTSPLRLVEEALQRLADDPMENIADFLIGLDEGERAELRAEVNNLVAAFVELWPPLQPGWRPQTEARRRAELGNGMIVLSGKVDLTLGAPMGLVAGRVVVDLKTGARHAGHVDDLRFYALLDTLRGGVPPFRLVTYYLESGTLATEEVTEDVLEAAIRRTVAATRKIVELHTGLRSPQVTPNPACRWCRIADECDGAAEWNTAIED
jgi:RecB family exonuclease